MTCSRNIPATSVSLCRSFLHVVVGLLMESSEFDTSLVNRQSGPEVRILVCVKRSGVFLRSTKRRDTRLGLCSQGHSFVSLRITKVCFTTPNWLKVQEKACALAYRITRSIVVETFRFTYVHTHFLLFRIRLPSFPSLYQIPNPITQYSCAILCHPVPSCASEPQPLRVEQC